MESSCRIDDVPVTPDGGFVVEIISVGDSNKRRSGASSPESLIKVKLGRPDLLTELDTQARMQGRTSSGRFAIVLSQRSSKSTAAQI